MGGKFSRTKGHSFERLIAKTLRVVFPKAARQLEYQENQCKGIDLANTGNFKIQCKRGKKYANLSAIKEVQADEMMGEIPVLITKGDNERILAALPFEDFLYLLKASRIKELNYSE